MDQRSIDEILSGAYTIQYNTSTYNVSVVNY